MPITHHGGLHAPDAAHIARHSPARVVADVAAKRAIIAEARLQTGTQSADPADPDLRGQIEERREMWIHDVLMPLARVYAEHPDFDPEWAAT